MSTTLEPNTAPSDPRWLLHSLLGEQRQLSAVEEFAKWHDHDAPPTQQRYYRDLLPTRLPVPGEQLAFEVDLDACSGCKACVVACHNLNGLEPTETWRGVGLLVGGTTQLPVLQHVTTACHHCLEPACLDGCPVLAYEKDDVTGIVRHLDDQCIGCQYCILKCPYDVPKYSPTKGIVRKCDMCSTRLAVGEAPACVQSCPHEAIKITIVARQQIVDDCEANLFLPGAPEPGYTLPSTTYKTKRVLPRNLLPTDYFAARPQHAHWPLIWMLVFTQASVGALVVDQAWRHLGLLATADDLIHRITALALGMVGLIASVFHLGRPQLAYRAWIGLRTSWLSREIVAFGLFAASAGVYASTPLVSRLGIDIPAVLDRWLGITAAGFGVGGVLCSALIYASTRRPFWNLPNTLLKFMLTGAIVGLPVVWLVVIGATGWSEARPLLTALVIASLAKLALEASSFTWLTTPVLTPLKRTAQLLVGELRPITAYRFLVGLAGGVALPAVLLAQASASPATVALGVVMLLANVGGELLERYLFFTAVVAPKMPGVPSA